MPTRSLAVAALLALPLAGCGLGSSSGSNRVTTQDNSPGPASPAPSGCPNENGGHPSADTPATYATALAFTPGGTLFWAERGGSIKEFVDGAARTFATVETVTAEKGGGYSERGLLGLALSPGFATDHLVYAFYHLADYAHARVVRWVDCGGTAVNLQVVIDNLPTGADCCHKGGRLAFGLDGSLFVTMGDNHSAPAAQDRCDLRGKILRYNADGSIPPSGNICGAVYAMGLRNPFGIAFNNSAGTLMITSNGPSGDAGTPATGYDTVDVVQAGGNYQWPRCYGYSHPIGGSACPAGSHEPDYSTESSTEVPTGATFTSAMAPFAGHFVYCSYALKILRVFNGARSVSGGPSGCQLDVKEGPDHALYFSDTTTIHRYSG